VTNDEVRVAAGPVTVQLTMPGATPANGATCLRLDGQDITRFCRAVTIRSEVGKVNTATVDVNALEGLDLSLPVNIQLLVTVFAGYELIEELTATGKRWTARRIDEAAA
jgi:hypothetical protein